MPRLDLFLRAVLCAKVEPCACRCGSKYACLTRQQNTVSSCYQKCKLSPDMRSSCVIAHGGLCWKACVMSTLPAKKPQGQGRLSVGGKVCVWRLPACTHCNTSLQVRLGCADAGEPVAESPYPVRVLPGRPDPRRCTLSGAGRRAAVAAVAAQFSVEARDCYGNRWRLSGTARQCAMHSRASRKRVA